MIARVGGTITAVVLLVSAALAVPASAGEITVIGSGTVTNQTSGGGGTIDAADDAVLFSVTYDPATLLLIGSDAQLSVYRIDPAGLSASIGGHSLMFDPLSADRVQLIFRTGFAFFGGSSSEAVLLQTFQFNGVGGAGSPVRIAGLPPTRDFIAFTSTFRTGLVTVPPTLASFRDPAGADRTSFTYAATAANPRAFGTASGSFEASLVAAPGVPEPASWAMMILGFGLVGAAMRRRRVAPRRSVGRSDCRSD